jgi:hypothetical protein
MVMLQVDFAPTMAALLGVPMPYACIGRVSHGLWHLRGCGGGGDSQTCRQRYAATLQANAWQVRHRRLLQCMISLHRHQTHLALPTQRDAPQHQHSLPKPCLLLTPQVQRYLQDYAASDGGHLPTADLTRSQELYAAVMATGEAEAGSDAHISK